MLKRVLLSLAVVGVFTGLCVRLHRNSLTAHMHIDEVYWTGGAYYFDLAFLQRRWRHEDWKLLPARENPPVGRYLIGGWLAAHDIRVTSLRRLGLFLRLHQDNVLGLGVGESYEKRKRVADRTDLEFVRNYRRDPYVIWPNGMLSIARRLNVILYMLTLLAVFAVGAEVASVRVGLLAAVLVGLHPLVVPIAAWINVDFAALFFSTLTILHLRWVTSRVWSRTKHPRLVASAVAISGGVCLAFACGSKMNASIVAITAAVLWVVSAVQTALRREGAKHALCVLSAIIPLSLILFTAINPALYPNVLDGMYALVHEHRLTAQIQAKLMSGYLAEPSERFPVLFDLVFVGAHPWAAGLLGVAVAFQFIRWTCGWREPVICLWWLTALLAIGLWMPFGWFRYALPFIPPTMLLAAQTTDDIMAWSWGQLKKLWSTKRRVALEKS